MPSNTNALLQEVSSAIFVSLGPSRIQQVIERPIYENVDNQTKKKNCTLNNFQFVLIRTQYLLALH